MASNLRYEDFFLPLSIDETGGVRQTANLDVLLEATRSRVTPARQLGLGAGNIIPLIYGTYKAGAQIIEAGISSIPILGHQKLRLLVCFGYGPVYAIGDINKTALTLDELPNTIGNIFLDDNDLANFSALKIAARFGDFDQDYLPGSQNQLNTQIINHTFSTSGTLVSFTTVNEVDLLNFEFNFPNGAFDKGPAGNLTVGLLFQYRFRESTGPGAWSAWFPIRFEGFADSSFNVSTQGREPLSSQVGGPAFSRAQYDIEIVYLGTDPANLFPGSPDPDPRFISVTEYGGSPRAYPGMVLLELQDVVASETNTEAPKSVTALIRGRLVKDISPGPATLGSVAQLASSNPALNAIDLLLNPVFGLGRYFTVANLDLESFLAWKNYCDEIISGTDVRHTFDAILNTPENAWTVFLNICRSSFAFPRYVDGRLSIVLDKARAVEFLVSQASVITGSLDIQWRDRDQLYDAVEVTFNSVDLDYDSDTEVARRATPFERGSYRTQNLSPLGVTRRNQAARYATRRLNENLYRRQVIIFEMQLSGFALQPGDLFYFAHDLVGYGFSGRITASWPSPYDGDEYFLVFDRDLTIVTGDLLYILNNENDAFSTHASAPATSPDGVYPAGTPIAFDGFTSTAEPGRFSDFSYGTEPGKPFEVQTIELTQVFTLKIQALEYSASVYTDVISDRDTDYTRLPRAGVLPAAVTSLAAANVTRTRLDGTTFSTVQVSWQVTNIDFVNGIPAPSYVEVHVRALGRTYWQLVGTVNFPGQSLILTEELVAGTTYEFTAVPVSIRGNKGSPDTSPSVFLVFFGSGVRPQGITGLAIAATNSDSLDIVWDRLVDESEIAYYELRYGTGWNSGVTLATVLSGTSTIPQSVLKWNNTTGLTAGSYEIENYLMVRAMNIAGLYSSTQAAIPLSHPQLGLGTISADEIGSAVEYINPFGFKMGFTLETVTNHLKSTTTKILQSSPTLMENLLFTSTFDSTLVATPKFFIFSFTLLVSDNNYDWTYTGTWADGNIAWESELENQAWTVEAGIQTTNTLSSPIIYDEMAYDRNLTEATTDRYCGAMLRVVNQDPSRYTIKVLETRLISHA